MNPVAAARAKPGLGRQHTTFDFPVLEEEAEADIRRIAHRFKADPEGYSECRRRAGVSFEGAKWQSTPMGDFVIAHEESHRSSIDATGSWAEQATEIDRFFVAMVKEVHGVDPTHVPEGPPPQAVGE